MSSKGAKGERVAGSVFSLLLVVLIITQACVSLYTYRVPEEKDDGWRTGNLIDVGLDEKLLSTLIGQIRTSKIENIHGILIAKNGKLVFEEYFDGYRFDYSAKDLRGERFDQNAENRHNIMSITKAVTAALVGIAIDRGLIESEYESVFSYFPEYAHLKTNGKENITLEHLLTLTSGLAWNEWDIPLTDTENDLIQLFLVDDPIAYILEKELIHDPGSFWYYSGGDVNLLGEAFRHATGIGIDQFAEKYLFSPMGITDYKWKYINEDLVYSSGELELRPRDMAKFGYLFLHDGVWNGKQIISQEWAKKSIREHASTRGRTDEGEGYGYQWWQKRYVTDSMSVDSIIRTGWGGQAIILFPALDMLVVLTGGNYIGKNPVNEIVEEFILPAVNETS